MSVIEINLVGGLAVECGIVHNVFTGSVKGMHRQMVLIIIIRSTHGAK